MGIGKRVLLQVRFRLLICAQGSLGVVRDRLRKGVRYSRVAQRERAGPITQRSMDRNHPLLWAHIFACYMAFGSPAVGQGWAVDPGVQEWQLVLWRHHQRSGLWIQRCQIQRQELCTRLVPSRGHLGQEWPARGHNDIWFYGVMVSTLDFESSDPSSNLGRTCFACGHFCLPLLCPRQ